MSILHSTKTIFFDLEVTSQGKLGDIGAISINNHVFHDTNPSKFFDFIKDADFLIGHNILNHDIKYLKPYDSFNILDKIRFIDTLYLSPLLYPKRPYGHSLFKDDKLFIDDINNPVSDSKKARDLFLDEIQKFNTLEVELKCIYYNLLHDQPEFKHFFSYNETKDNNTSDYSILIANYFSNKICCNTDVSKLLLKPIPLSYCLALINIESSDSRIAPWVLRSFPEAENIFRMLRGTPCNKECIYCQKFLNPLKTLKKYFGFESFRSFDGNNLQEKAVHAAVKAESMVVVFPTGGGKSLTFQVPALMDADNENSLTVIISPLVALMKDQVDNLETSFITSAVTINGLLDPIERAKAINRISDGEANILYIAPESLRSNTIFQLLLNRKISRFVIDEAHCFSSWGHDFRIDYQYIGDFIKELVQSKKLDRMIPVSCFTATAKKNVIEDIKSYFSKTLSLDLMEFSTGTQRKNLHYEIFEEESDSAKFNTLINLVEDNDPTIVYVSRTKKAQKIAERLTKAGYNACFYHGKLDNDVKRKNQEDFKNGNINIMVATSAFGMGVDKKDIKRVIHYDISDSIENYVQEAGRAGRDENINAECSILYNESDIDKHFVMLQQSKLHKAEIQQIWNGIKKLARKRTKISNSALEIARAAGWDDSLNNLESKVTTAIAALERSNYVLRSRNSPRIFATSIQSKTAQEAIDKIRQSDIIIADDKEKAERIIKKLISQKTRALAAGKDAESRVDYITDELGIHNNKVIEIINLLKQEGILADDSDLSASLIFDSSPNKVIENFILFSQVEKELIDLISTDKHIYNLKALSDDIRKTNGTQVNPIILKTIGLYWGIRKFAEIHNIKPNIVSLVLKSDFDSFKNEMVKRHQDCGTILRYLVDITKEKLNESNKGDVILNFSMTELLNILDPLNHDNIGKDFGHIQNCLFYLSKLNLLKIEDGFIVMYNRLQLERKELDNKKRFTDSDYKELNEYYENRSEQIHIVAEYAKKLLTDYEEALTFVNDYFILNYSSFINKYFPDATKRESLSKPISPKKFREIFEAVSPRQSQILKAKEKTIAVIAGPGSGKTKVLVHKMAAQLYLENVKSEQLLMLTFSRSATSEFKNRLFDLIGNAAAFVEIKTFHSYCFDLLGRMGSLNNSLHIVNEAIEGIKNGTIELSRITKLSLLIDEAQDMSKEEYELIQLLVENNKDLKLIVVGDDLQNIYAFRGSNSKYLESICKDVETKHYELIENFRSTSKVVAFSNKWVAENLTTLRNEALISKNSTNDGIVKVVEYLNSNFEQELAVDIQNTSLSGTSAVFTRNNEEAAILTGVFSKMKIPYHLVNSNEGFNMVDLWEIKAFSDILLLINENGERFSEESWDEAKEAWKNKFSESPHFDSCVIMMQRFESDFPKNKIHSEWIDFIMQSRFEDFLTIKHDMIYIMTLHKSKGKEFDNVYILLKEGFKLTEEEKRLIFVGITRAKTNLSIHTNTKFFNKINIREMEYIYGREGKQIIDCKQITLTHKDVQLGYFDFVNRDIELLYTGQDLKCDNEACFTLNNKRVVKFSETFKKAIQIEKEKGFLPTKATIQYIVYWKNDNDVKIKILLPEITFNKNN